MGIFCCCSACGFFCHHSVDCADFLYHTQLAKKMSFDETFEYFVETHLCKLCVILRSRDSELTYSTRSTNRGRGVTRATDPEPLTAEPQ